jgi:polyferredoxin
MSKRQRYNLKGILRRLSQGVFAFLFLFLFIKTDYTGSDELQYAVNILFRLDPLLAACTVLAAKTLIGLMVPSLILVVLSLLLGRSFCGWVCPMGSFIDLSHPIVNPKKKVLESLFPRLPYIVLIFVLAAAVFQMPLVGYFDPFSILVRGLALAFYPALNFGTTEFFTFTYHYAPEFVNSLTEPVYAALQATILPSDQKIFGLTYLCGGILLGVFLLELRQRRFFCRNICPLGGLLGLLAGVGWLHGHGGGKDCGKCRLCQSVCRMGAIDENRQISRQACILCMECQEKCLRSVISFGFSKPKKSVAGVSLSRRQFVGALASGAAMPIFAGVRPLNQQPNPLLIRPPGALAEKDFLARCVRCGECMQVCIGNALHPTFLQAGFEGMFSPVLIGRTGYCEFNCTLCGQVCPTGAIRHLDLAEKHTLKIGNAYFDKNRCLPYAKGIPCIVCEEHCPTPQKAIAFREAVVINEAGEQVKVKQPYIIDKLCVGCGICENKCPLSGTSAVLVTSEGEVRNPENTMGLNSGYG